jgi:hypothetical protein
MIHENSSHGFSGGREEMASVVPTITAIAAD